MDKSLYEILVRAFDEKKDDARAKQMKAYMKGKFAYFGLTSPIRKEIQQKVLAANMDLYSTLVLKPFVEMCWNHPCRELQYAALDIMRRKKKELAEEEDIPFIMVLVRAKSWWDTIDFLSSFHMGYILDNMPEIKPKYIDKWIRDENMWVRRTAILAQLKMKERTDFNLLKQCILLTADEKEFFIRKASGWALREYSKTNAPAVLSFVEGHKDSLSGLTVREALKWLQRKDLNSGNIS